MNEPKIIGNGIVEGMEPCPWCAHTPGTTSYRVFAPGTPKEYAAWQVRCGYSECRVRPMTYWCLSEQEAVDQWQDRKNVPSERSSE